MAGTAVARVVGVHAFLAGQTCLSLREIIYSHWKLREMRDFFFQVH